MPSPFPGMNPYFEQADVWHDFQIEFLLMLRRQLVPGISPKYFIQFQRPDEARLSTPDDDRPGFLEIRDREGRELVTVIELLSPSNKRPLATIA